MKILVILSICFILLIFSSDAYAKQWFYPMDDYFERQQVKGFGQNIDDQFYQSKEKLFPFNRFYGFHAGIDLEVFEDENDKLIPVYAVGSGTISYIGTLSGYGGVILLKLDDQNHTALYGHVKITKLKFRVGDKVTAGQILTFLGDAFSHETSKERKHLHFAIYKGGDLYFRGHEYSLDTLYSKWEDPNNYLKSASPTPTPTLSTKTVEKSQNILYAIFKKFLLFLGIIGIK